jgi:alanyl-tRNA synthetase
VTNDKPLIIATVTEDLIQRGLKAGDLVREVAKIVGGGGGGRPNLAQAGGRDASKLPQALAIVPALVEQALS